MRNFLYFFLAVLLTGCAVFDSADKEYETFHKDIAGAWTSADDGARLTFFPTGFFKIELPSSPDMFVRGKYVISADQIVFDGIPDNYLSLDFNGTYTYEMGEDTLVFESASAIDPSVEEYQLDGKWLRASPME